jgi:hypothetical protein
MRVGHILTLSLVGCLASSSPETTTAKAPPRADIDRGDRDRIERAFAAHDERALHELLDIITDRNNHALASAYYVRLRLDALASLECDAFFAAFQPVHQRPNPRTDFGALTAELEPRQREYVISTVESIAARCHSPQLFLPMIRRVVPDADVAAWTDALIALDRKGIPVYDAYVATLRSSAKGIDTKLVNQWLVATKPATSCHGIEEAARTASPDLRASLIYFYTAKGCRTEVVRSARELLASRVAGFRARGCRALREVGDTSLISEMEQLAKSDPARKLEDDRDGIWTYSYETFPVRETCQQAIAELQTKQGG